MTEKMMTNDKALTPQDILGYLKENPKFLVDNPEIMEVLTPPDVKKGRGVVDFQHFMVQRLKTEKKRTEETTKSIVETTRANMDVQTRIHTSVIRLLDARSFEEFIEMVTTELAVILDTDIITIIVESTGEDIPHVHTPGVRIVQPGVIEHFLKGRDSFLEKECMGHEIIFGGGAGLVRSQALQRLNISGLTPNAMICFGSRDPQMFTDGQGTELIGFLADVIERLIRTWLQLS